MDLSELIQKLDSLETRKTNANLIFLRPGGAKVAYGVIAKDQDQSLTEEIEQASPAIDQLLWTVPQARSYFRKMIIRYIYEHQEQEDLTEGFLKYFQAKPMSNALRCVLSEHLHENNVGLSAAMQIWAKLYALEQK